MTQQIDRGVVVFSSVTSVLSSPFLLSWAKDVPTVVRVAAKVVQTRAVKATVSNLSTRQALVLNSVSNSLPAITHIFRQLEVIPDG